MGKKDHILKHALVPADKNALGKPLHLYIVPYHDDFRTSTALGSKLLRSYLDNRVSAYDARIQGLYQPGGFKHNEDNADNYFSLVADEHGDVIAGSRVTYAKNHYDIQYRDSFATPRLDAALDALSKDKGGLRFAEDGGIFSKPELQRKGLGKLSDDFLVDFSKGKVDVHIWGMFSDLAGKYVAWAKERGMKQIYLMPDNKHTLGYTLIYSPLDKQELPLEEYFKQHGVAYVDTLNTEPSNQVKVQEVIETATKRQQDAAARGDIHV